MNRIMSAVLVIAAVFTLAACGTLDTRPGSTEELGYKTRDTLKGKLHLKKARELREVMELEGQMTAAQSQQMLLEYREAYRYLPNSFSVQEGYYSALYSRDLARGVASEVLKQLYAQFPDFIQKDFMPPEYIAGIAALRMNNLPLATTEFQTGLQSSTGNAQLWALWAFVQGYSDRLPLSYYSWKKAAEYGGNARTYINMAETLTKMVSRKSCMFDAPYEMELAAQHYSKAAAMEERVDLYWDAVLYYYRSGRLPLAMHMARKATELGDSETDLFVLAEISVARGDYQSAIDWVKQAEEEENADIPYMDAAVAYFALGQDELALNYLEQSTNNTDGLPPILVATIANWLSDLIEQPLNIDIHNAATEPDWLFEQSVREYLEAGKADSTLIDQSEDTCQRSEALFYSAYVYWISGDVNGARRLLEQAAEEKAFSYQERRTAKAILHRMNSDQKH